jgi:hypothetical protein
MTVKFSLMIMMMTKGMSKRVTAMTMMTMSMGK